MEMLNSVAVIILARNESIHIERAVKSALTLTDRVYVIDSNSTDGTYEKAMNLGVSVCNCNVSVANNFADKFNWALDNLNIQETWLVRLDADEYFLPETVNALPDFLKSVDDSVSGITLNRRIVFQGRWIKNGGQYPRPTIRITRNGCARYERRLLDEQVILRGGRIKANLDFVDDNLNNISSWIYKHDAYAIKEAIEIIHFQVGLFSRNMNSEFTGPTLVIANRKKSFYLFWPPYLRPFIYFLYRYVIQLGFLDGVPGFLWNFFQGWWYRVLVEIKIKEITRECGKDADKILLFIQKNYSNSIS
jgi:glycosyltransferase involved in cell wall biosynthesis